MWFIVKLEELDFGQIPSWSKGQRVNNLPTLGFSCSFLGKWNEMKPVGDAGDLQCLDTQGLRPAVWWFAQQVVSKWRACWNLACRLLVAFPWWKPWTNCRRWAMNSPIHHMALPRAETRSTFEFGCLEVSPWPILTACRCQTGPSWLWKKASKLVRPSQWEPILANCFLRILG